MLPRAKRAQWVRTMNEIINSAGPAPPARHPQALDLKTQNMPNMKCCVVGDCAVGKTSLLTMHTANEWPDEVIEKGQYRYYKHIKVEGQPTNLELHDTPGDPSYGALRPLAYPGTDMFISSFRSRARPPWRASRRGGGRRSTTTFRRHPGGTVHSGGHPGRPPRRPDHDRPPSRCRRTKGEAPVTTLMGSATAEKLGARCYLKLSGVLRAHPGRSRWSKCSRRPSGVRRRAGIAHPTEPKYVFGLPKHPKCGVSALGYF